MSGIKNWRLWTAAFCLPIRICRRQGEGGQGLELRQQDLPIQPPREEPKKKSLRPCLSALSLAASLLAGAFSQQAHAQAALGEPVAPLSVVYYAADMGPEFEQSARALSDEWRKLGLELQLRPIQFGTFVSQIIVGGQLDDIAVFTVGGDPDRVDPTYWLYDIAACGQRRNGSKFCNQEYSRLAAEQRTKINSAERLKAVHDLQVRFHQEMPWWPVINRVYGIIWNNQKWENVKSPSPVAAHEALTEPWLSMKPKTSDRWLDWAYFEDVKSYNPIVEEGAVGWMRFIFDTFAKNNTKGETVPWAAQSWKFVNDRTIEITMRDGMTFHDDKPVTVNDAVFTIQKLIEWQPPAMSSRIRNLASAEKIDDKTFRIRLKEPDAAFELTVLTYLFILPEHIWRKAPAKPTEWDLVAAKSVIGSGPFKFKTWRLNEVHELETHRGHFQAPAYDGIRRLALGQADAIRAAMLSGRGDIATTVLPVATMSDLAKQNSQLSFMESPSHSTMFVWVNNQKPPFSDRAFRQALRIATNKQRVMVEGWQGFASVSGEGNVPTALGRWHNGALEKIPFDIPKARKALADAGYGWDARGRLHMPKK
jgi:peptide/nickel transport system substrate-binding protein